MYSKTPAGQQSKSPNAFVQPGRHALRTGGLVLPAHTSTQTFGDVFVTGECD